MGLKNTGGGGGEIVQVQGGHIIRATGRKDRHSKVFTAKGPRDRRVRLAAHTAIQFYDVQDRLGYDRPSKAVDWLINKANASIDKLAELPPWDPMATSHSNNNEDSHANNNNSRVSEQISLGSDNNPTSQFYVPQCDSMKSFFPTNNNTCGENNNSSMNFQNYPQDLCLSLHTLHDPGAGGSTNPAHPGHDQSIFNGGFDGGWAQQQDVGRFTRLMGWAGDNGSGGSGGSGGGEGRGGIMFNNNSPQLLSTMANFATNQRGTLQSSYSAFVRGFEDNQDINHNHQSISDVGHGSDSFMGFYIPSQIHGDLHGGSSMSNRASSSSLSPDI